MRTKKILMAGVLLLTSTAGADVIQSTVEVEQVQAESSQVSGSPEFTTQDMALLNSSNNVYMKLPQPLSEKELAQFEGEVLPLFLIPPSLIVIGVGCWYLCP